MDKAISKNTLPDLEKSFDCACAPAAQRLKRRLITMKPEDKARVQEIRLRAGRAVMLTAEGDNLFLTESGALTGEPDKERIVTASSEEVSETFKNLCNHSVYSHRQEIKSGYITIKGGHRAGITGTAVWENDSVSNVRNIGGINIRVASSHMGCSEKIAGLIDSGGILICGEPCSGKTTMLRDLAFQLSVSKRLRVTVVDSRGEICALSSGVAREDSGSCDILDGYTIRYGVEQALRCLSPQVIICDELGAEDVDSLARGLNSGVSFITTVHCKTPAQLKKRSQGVKLLETGAFSHLVFLKSCKDAGAISEIIKVGELPHG